jgi:prepilin-type N-terminal cleavage/methylation domain-containing protein
MSPNRSSECPRSTRGVAGFTMIELLVASAIAIATTGAMIQVTRGAHAAFTTMNDLVDVQQKMRVAADAIQHDLTVAGAGSTLPAGGGPLVRYLPPIRPAASISGDTDLTYASDRVTLLFVPQTNAEAGVTTGSAATLSIEGGPSCARSPQCGFSSDMRALVFDRMGPGFGYDLFTAGDVSPASIGRALDEGPFSRIYPDTAYVTQVVDRTYFLDRSDPSNVRLMRGDGRTSFPLVDGVRDLHFTYYADPDPSSVSMLGAAAGTCAYAAGAPPRPLLAPLGGASLSELSASELTDGPLCGVAPNRFDADLLRIRRVRVVLQVAPSATAGGRSTSYELSFDVTPHNLSLSR